MDDQHEKKLDEVINAFIKSNKLNDKYYQVKLIEHWESLVGKTIAKHTTDLHLNKGTLFVQLDSAPLKQELSFHKDRIRSVVNEHFSASIIKEIVFR